MKIHGRKSAPRRWLLGAAALTAWLNAAALKDDVAKIRKSALRWKMGNCIRIGSFLILFCLLMPPKASFHPNTCLTVSEF